MTTGWGSLSVGIGFGSAALDTAATRWNVYSDVIDIRTIAGRKTPFDPFPPATCDIVLDNTARTYDPLYASGTFYGQLKPLRQVAITANDSGSTSRILFFGFIAPPPYGWTFDYPRGRDATVTLHCVDGLTFLESYNLAALAAPAFGGELSGARVNRVLDTAGWPAAWRSVDAGQTVLQDTSYGMSAAEHLRKVAISEGGAFYFDPSGIGVATFNERHAVLKQSRMTTSQATFSDTGSDVDMSVTSWDFGGELRNDWQVGREGGPVQEVSDATSLADNGPQNYVETALFMQNDPEAYARAEWGVKAYKDGLFAPKTIQIEAHDSNAALDQALQRVMRDRVTVKFTPPGGGSQNSGQAFIESIAHDIPVRAEPTVWRTTFGLSSADRFGFTNYAQYLKLDDAALGLLGTGRLAF